MWVSPFRYLRLIGYLLLPEAFRSLSRLSSALSAKASTLRSFLLGHSDLIALTSDGWCCLVCFYFFAVFLQRLVSSLSYVLRILDVSYMQFSRYDYGSKTFVFLPSGDKEIRTLDPLLARQVLSQLSYTPMDAGLPSFEAIPYSFMFCIYFNQPVTSCITLLGNGLKWTRTTDLTLIRRAL